MDYKAEYARKKGTVEDCLSLIHSEDVVVFAGDGNAPLSFGAQFHTIAPRVENVKVFKDFTNYYPFPAMDGMKGHIFTQSFFFGKDMREGLAKGNSSFFPADMSMNGSYICENQPTVFISAATEMDESGNFQIGLSNMWEPDSLDYVRSHGGRILLEVNRNLPRVNGAPEVNISDVAALTEVDTPITLIPPKAASPEEVEVAKNVRSLIHNGDCVQFGIGALPNAIAELCMDLNDLGMHTEMLTSSMAKMVREGVITGKKKNFLPDEHIFTFAGGDEALFETLKANTQFRITPGSWGCDPFIIAKNNNMVSVNTCVEMDLMGQIASEAIGTRQFSGSGGAFCFTYGALRSKGGRAIMAFASKSAKGFSKIRATLGAGSAVTIPRNYADYIVTEYGIAHLRGKTLRERANALIAVAHPDFREELANEAKKLLWI